MGGLGWPPSDGIHHIATEKSQPGPCPQALLPYSSSQKFPSSLCVPDHKLDDSPRPSYSPVCRRGSGGSSTEDTQGDAAAKRQGHGSKVGALSPDQGKG